jgi:hypothetical protein
MFAMIVGLICAICLSDLFARGSWIDKMRELGFALLSQLEKWGLGHWKLVGTGHKHGSGTPRAVHSRTLL